MCQELTSPPSPAPHRFLPHRPAALSPHTPHCPLLAARPGPARARGCGGARSYSERTDDSKDKKRRCGTAPPRSPGSPRSPRTCPHAAPGPAPPPPAPARPVLPRGRPAGPGSARRSAGPRGAHLRPDERRGPRGAARSRSGAAPRPGDNFGLPRAPASRARAPSAAATQAGPGARAAPRCPPAAPRTWRPALPPLLRARLRPRACFPRPAMSHRAELPRSEGA